MASSIPSFAALPSNTVSGSFSVSLFSTSPTYSAPAFQVCDFGSFYRWYMHVNPDLASATYKVFESNFTITLDSTADIFILTSNTFDFDDLSSYRDISSEFSGSFDFYSYDAFFGYNSNYYTAFTGLAHNAQAHAYFFDDVPAGSYSIISNISSFRDEDFICDLGIFIDSGAAPISSALDSYVSGETSLLETLSFFDEQLESDLFSAGSDTEKQFIIQKYIYNQEKIISLSDIANKNSVSSSLSEFREVLSDFRDSDKSSSDFVSAVSNLTSAYSESITSAESAEQIQLLNSSYSVVLQDLQLAGDQAVGSTIDQIITQDDIDLMSDVEELEDFLVELDLADFDTWYEDFSEFGQSIFADSEYQTMREVFEFFLSDDEPFTYFIRWPIFLVFFSIILGTSFIMIRRHSNGSGSVRRSS